MSKRNEKTSVKVWRRLLASATLHRDYNRLMIGMDRFHNP